MHRRPYCVQTKGGPAARRRRTRGETDSKGALQQRGAAASWGKQQVYRFARTLGSYAVHCAHRPRAGIGGHGLACRCRAASASCSFFSSVKKSFLSCADARGTRLTGHQRCGMAGHVRDAPTPRLAHARDGAANGCQPTCSAVSRALEATVLTCSSSTLLLSLPARGGVAGVPLRLGVCSSRRTTECVLPLARSAAGAKARPGGSAAFAQTRQPPPLTLFRHLL